MALQLCTPHTHTANGDGSIPFNRAQTEGVFLEADAGISILDNSLGIDWHIPTDKVLLSEKDLKHALLKDFDSPFSIGMNLYPEFEKK